MSRHAPGFIERRSEPRVAVSAAARVMHGTGLSLWADCVIRDLSHSGAKLELSHVHSLPPRFILLHFQAGTAFEVILKWRRGDLAGVAFEARHALDTTTEARLAPVQAAWRALHTGFTPKS